MFNLNENNRFAMSRNPMDLREGVDSLCGAVRSCALDSLKVTYTCSPTAAARRDELVLLMEGISPE